MRRVLVAFDVVTRYLRSLGYRVTYVRNVTDIDDKIIARANENSEDFRALTRRFTEFMHEDCRALGVLEPDVEPHATHYIEPIVSMVETLIENGAAYCGANGDVYYDVSRFPAYGALSDKRIEGPAQRRPGGDRRSEGRSAGFRAVESLQAR